MKGQIKGFIDKVKSSLVENKGKNAEEELRLYSEIMENMAEGVILIRVSDAVIVYTNLKFEEMFGYGPGELIGRNISVVNAPSHKSPEEIAGEIQKCLREKGVWRGDVYNIKKDGTPFWCRANVSTFEHHKYGKVWVATHTDITEHKKAEEKLKESEEKYHALVENSPDFIAIYQEGTLKYVNNSMCKRLGWTFEEMTSASFNPIEKIIPQRLQSQIRENIAKRLKEESIDPYEISIKARDGSEIPVIVKAKAILYRGKLADEVIHIDITERKKAEERFLKLNQTLINLSTDFDDNINKITAACGELLGADCALYSRLDGDLLCSVGQWKVPKDYNPKDKPQGHICFDVIKSKENKICIINNLHQTNYFKTDPNVKKYNLKTYMGYPVICSGSAVGSLCAVFQKDIKIDENDKKILGILAKSIGLEEERKKVEEKLKENEEKWLALTNNSKDIIMIVDQNHLIEYISIVYPVYKIENVIGRPVYDYMPKEQHNLVRDSLDEVFRTGKVSFYEVSSVIPKISTIWFNTKLVPIKRNGKVYRVIEIASDITERKKAEIEKERLQERLRKYAKKLELKVKELEKDKISLTEKEKLVLWGITRYPNSNDKKLAKRLKIKRSTVTAIRNRLREKEVYSVINIPNFKALGVELITFYYGRFNMPYEKRREVKKAKGIVPISTISNYYVSTDNEFVGGLVSKNMAEFEKSMAFAVNKAEEHSIIKNCKFVHFLFELNKMYRLMDYSSLLKHLFKIKIPEKAEEEEEEKVNLSNNEKKILLTMIEYPGLSAYDLSFKVNLTRATVAKIKKKLIKQKLIKTAVAPNLQKIGLGLLMLTHTKHGHGFKEEALKAMLKVNPHVVFLVGGNREAIAMSWFKNYDEYQEFKKMMPSGDRNIFIEEPIMFKLSTKNIKSRSFNFLETTKRLLG